MLERTCKLLSALVQGGNKDYEAKKWQQHTDAKRVV